MMIMMALRQLFHIVSWNFQLNNQACVDHRELLFDLLVQRAASAGIEAPVALSRCTGFRSRHRCHQCWCFDVDIRCYVYIYIYTCIHMVTVPEPMFGGSGGDAEHIYIYIHIHTYMWLHVYLFYIIIYHYDLTITYYIICPFFLQIPIVTTSMIIPQCFSRLQTPTS